MHLIFMQLRCEERCGCLELWRGRVAHPDEHFCRCLHDERTCATPDEAMFRNQNKPPALLHLQGEN